MNHADTSKLSVSVAEKYRFLGSFQGLKKLCNEGRIDEALWTVRLMCQHRRPVSTSVLYCILLECMNKEDLESGREAHRLIVRNGLESNTFLGSHLIRMFAACGSLCEANQVFTRLPDRSVFTWNAIISSYAKFGQCAESIKLYHQMQRTSVQPDGHIFVTVLKACASIESLPQGKLIHAHIIESSFEWCIFVGSSLIDMYAKCGSLDDARSVFSRLRERDVVTWNAMIAGCAQNGHGHEALQLLVHMSQEGLEPDKVTFVSILKACSSIICLDKGKLIHAHIMLNVSELDLSVGNSIIDMYSKCGSLDDVCNVFERLPKRDVVTWGAVMAGCAEHGQGHRPLQLFQQMQQEGMAPDRPIFLCILKSCSTIAALHHGKQTHARLIEINFESDVSVGNILVDMYAKCGSLEDAFKVFARLPKRDLVTWNTLIGGCAQNSNYGLALQFFKGLQEEGLKPDNVTFIALLCACNQFGLVDQACHQFNSMQIEYGISRTPDHHNCMIDLLGHAGHLMEAEDLLQTTPFESDIIGWISLLNHCKIHGNVALGRRCFDHLISMDCRDSAGYVLMSQIYSLASRWWDAIQVQELRKSANSWKKPGTAFIEIDHTVHDFVVGGTRHPQSEDIYAKLRRLCGQIEEEGYMPQLEVGLNLMLDEDVLMRVVTNR